MLNKKSESLQKPPHGLTTKLTIVFEHTLIRYLFVGGSAYLIEMLSLYTLRYIFDLSPVVSVAISFWVGFFVAFILQKTITFKNYERGAKNISRQLLGYSLLVAFNYSFTLLVVSIFHDKLNVIVLRTATIATITMWNFYIYGKLFKRKKNV